MTPAFLRLKSQVIDDSIQQAAQEGLRESLRTVRWVARREEITLDGYGDAVDGGGVLTLGNTLAGDDGKLCVAGSIHVTSLNASGQTYVFEFHAGRWVVTGTTDTRWVSQRSR